MENDAIAIQINGVGGRIRFEREKHGLSRETFAEIIDLSPFYIGQIERDERNMSIDTLIKVSDSLNISTDYILKGYDQYLQDISIQQAYNNNYMDDMDTEIKDLLDILSGASKKKVKLITDIAKLIIPHLIKIASTTR